MIFRLPAVACASYFSLPISRAHDKLWTDAPQAVATSACPDTIAGAHRLAPKFGGTAQFRLHFDVPEDNKQM